MAIRRVVRSRILHSSDKTKSYNNVVPLGTATAPSLAIEVGVEDQSVGHHEM